MKAKIGDVYTIYNNRLRLYTACQITNVIEDKGDAICLYLDWTGESPLHLVQMENLQPLYMDFMYWERQLCIANVDIDVPAYFIFVGNIPPLTNEENSYFGTGNYGYDVYRQIKWQQIPEERRKAFKIAMKSEETVWLNGTEYKISSHYVDDAHCPFSKADELKVFPCLSTLVLKEYHQGLIEYLDNTPFITELTYKGKGQRSLDFRGTSLRKLLIDLTGIDELWLNDEMEQLYLLNDKISPCVIHARDNGANLLLQYRKIFHPYPELSNLNSLHGIEINEVDMNDIFSVYPNLKELWLWGKPGYIRNFSVLESFRNIEVFATRNLFGFSSEDIPVPERMEHLNWLWMTSLPEDAAKCIKKLYKKRKNEGMNLSVTQARKPEWIKENMDNPFRDWDDSDYISPSSAKKAIIQYRKTRNELLALNVQNDPEAQTKAIAAVEEYTKTFNRMRCIETDERDLVYEVLCSIIDYMNNPIIDKARLLDRFEELRDF